MKKFTSTFLLVGVVLGSSLLKPNPLTHLFAQLLKNNTHEQPWEGIQIAQENPENVEPHRGSGRCDQCT